MKLWIKISCIALALTMLALSICLYTFAAWQTGNLLDGAERQAFRSLSIFCANMRSVERLSPGDDTDAHANRSVVNYYFAIYAHLFGADSYYSLVQDGAYLYNTCPYDPMRQLPAPDKGRAAWVTRDLGREYLFAAYTITVFSQAYTVYLCEDVSDIWQQSRNVARLSAMLILFAAMAMMLIVPWMVRRTLKPMDELCRTAERVAGGQYSLRAQAASEDEVAALATSLNHMAASMEEKINALTEESERRRLLLGALAHELRTPMTAIIGFADSLDQLPLTEEQRSRSARRIAEAGRRTERMSSKLMKLLSIEGESALERSLLSTSDLARDLWALYGERVRVECQAETLDGDRDLIMSLLQNLINNAMQAADEEDVVEITLGERFLSVTDHGRGIPAEHVARLTEPFYRVDKARSRTHGGAGLGLALCQAIVKAHGGRLMIDSVWGRGTTVTATLAGEEERYE